MLTIVRCVRSSTEYGVRSTEHGTRHPRSRRGREPMPMHACVSLPCSYPRARTQKHAAYHGVRRSRTESGIQRDDEHRRRRTCGQRSERLTSGALLRYGDRPSATNDPKTGPPRLRANVRAPVTRHLHVGSPHRSQACRIAPFTPTACEWTEESVFRTEYSYSRYSQDSPGCPPHAAHDS